MILLARNVPVTTCPAYFHNPMDRWCRKQLAYLDLGNTAHDLAAVRLVPHVPMVAELQARAAVWCSICPYAVVGAVQWPTVIL